MTAFFDIGLAYYYVGPPGVTSSIDAIMKNCHSCEIVNKLDFQDSHPTRRVAWSEHLIKQFSVKCDRFHETCKQKFGEKQIFKYRDPYNTIKEDFDIDCTFQVVFSIHRFGDHKPTVMKEMLCFEFPSELTERANLDSVIGVNETSNQGSLLQIELNYRQMDANQKGLQIVKSFTCHVVSYQQGRDYLSLHSYCDNGHIPIGFIQQRVIENNKTDKKVQHKLTSIYIDPNLFLLEHPESYFYDPTKEESDDDDY